MLYSFVRPLAALSLRHYYRKIDLALKERIPQDKPVILAANHPTAFIEPCILACFLDRPLYFLVRGDFFQKSLYNRLLRALHMLPVYRMKDGGYQNIKQNYATFEACFQALSERKTMMILAEGRCIHEKRLRPLRKGAARVALGALDKQSSVEEVYIVPVGVNFAYADRSLSDVMIRFGEPILASAYRQEYDTNPNGAITNLTDELAARLARHVIHIDRAEDEMLVEYLLRIYRNQHPRPDRPTITHDEQPLLAEKTIVDTVNELPATERTKLRELTYEYFTRLEWLRLDDAALAGHYRPAMRKTLRLLLLLPTIIAALPWHLPPLLTAHFIAGTKIKSLEFYQPVQWVAVTVLYLIYTLLWVLVTALAGAWVWLLYAILAFLYGGTVLRFFRDARAWRQGWRAWRQTPQELTYLKGLRRQILAAFPWPGADRERLVGEGSVV